MGGAHLAVFLLLGLGRSSSLFLRATLAGRGFLGGANFTGFLLSRLLRHRFGLVPRLTLLRTPLARLAFAALLLLLPAFAPAALRLVFLLLLAR